MTLCVRSPSPEHTRALGAALGRALGPGAVIGLSGPLGAGKTCFVQGLASGMALDGGAVVTSPTFTLVAEYSGPLPLRHADFYRVESPSRLDDAGFADLLDGRGVLVVEWAERFPEALPRDRLEVHIAIESDCERRLELLACGPVASEIEGRLGAPWR
jgi:tRNA threonylcarbamoyladenosine biosynthesis protein TsaE